MKDSHLASLLTVALFVSGCAGFQFPMRNSGASVPRPIPPNVSVASVLLTHSPTERQIARAMCPQVANPLVCNLLGPAPTAQDMKFSFDVELDVENTNSIPLPITSALAAFTAFPAATGQQNLGAVCMSLCEDPNSCPQNAANACESNEPEIRDIHDFAQAATNFLVAVVTGQERLENLRVRTVAPGAHTRVVFRLELNPEQVLALLRTVASDVVSQVASGRTPQIVIPYQVDGSIWITVEHFGRFAVTIPSYRNSWSL